MGYKLNKSLGGTVNITSFFLSPHPNPILSILASLSGIETCALYPWSLGNMKDVERNFQVHISEYNTTGVSVMPISEYNTTW